MSKLQSIIENEAQDFAAKIVAALRGASLDDLVGLTSGRAASKATNGKAVASAPAKRGPKKRGRRSAEDIKHLQDKIVHFVGKNPGLRAEQIRAQLGLAKKEETKPLTDALAAGRIKKKGNRRATTYQVK